MLILVNHSLLLAGNVTFRFYADYEFSYFLWQNIDSLMLILIVVVIIQEDSSCWCEYEFRFNKIYGEILVQLMQLLRCYNFANILKIHHL